MKIFCYTSPYEYYLDNIIPLIFAAKKRGHSVKASFSKEHTHILSKCNEIPIASKDRVLKAFFRKAYRPDVVILTQSWWYVDKEIARFCIKNGINFYIVDHAAPMTRFVEKNGKKSHLYRANTNGASAFFAYGRETQKIMSGVGCRDKVVVSGSPRIENQLEIAKKNCNNNKIVIYDTSHRMECEVAVKNSIKIAKTLSSSYNLDIFVRQHSRSPGLVAKKIGTNRVIDSEIEAAADSEFCIFTFPSSSMILPALLEKKLIAAYDVHYSGSIRKYYKKYMNEIFNHNNYAGNIQYNNFIKSNLKIPKDGSAEFIVKWIENNENSI